MMRSGMVHQRRCAVYLSGYTAVTAPSNFDRFKYRNPGPVLPLVHGLHRRNLFVGSREGKRRNRNSDQ